MPGENEKHPKKQHVEHTNLEPVKIGNFNPTSDSIHHVSTYKKTKKTIIPTGSSQAWVVKHLKPTSEQPTLFEIEGAMGDFYRLFLGPKEPKGRPIMSKSGPVGLMSKLIEGYTPVSSQNIDLQNHEHIRQLAEISVVAMFLEEGDLHEDNLGFNPKDELIKIDHGQSLWSIAKDYHRGGMGTVTDFSLNADDIRRLPDVKEGHSARICPLNDEETRTIANHPVFIEAKFRMLLKIVLMPDEVCQSICHAFISNPQLENRITSHLIDRRNELCGTLINMPEFRKYLIDHPDIINSIKDEYAQFNQEFHKDKHSHRRVDIDQVQDNFNIMLSEAQSHRLGDMLLDKIEIRLKALSSDGSTLAVIKANLFNQLKEKINYHSDEDIHDVFTRWKSQRYVAQNENDRQFDGKTYNEILSIRRKLDPRQTKSSIFISEATNLLKDKQTSKIHYDLDESDHLTLKRKRD